jgi:hypothetical protein
MGPQIELCTHDDLAGTRMESVLLFLLAMGSERDGFKRNAKKLHLPLDILGIYLICMHKKGNVLVNKHKCKQGMYIVQE